jgi:hypothetical protein
MAELDERARRIGLNEALFRQVNEKIQEVGERLGSTEEEPAHELLCECGNSNCTEQVSISPEAYQRIRSDPALFFIVPGHDVPEVEVVMAEAASYQIVRKRPGTPEDIAEATDPRSG